MANVTIYYISRAISKHGRSKEDTTSWTHDMEQRIHKHQWIEQTITSNRLVELVLVQYLPPSYQKSDTSIVPYRYWQFSSEGTYGWLQMGMDAPFMS